MTRNLFIAAFGLVALSLAANADSVSLTLDPISGIVSGSPGDNVGWGYTIDNNTSFNLLVAYSAFCESGQDLLIGGCSPNLGTSSYNDFTLFNYILIAPGDSASAALDPNALSGLGEYSIDPTITSGTDSGFITLVYDLYNGAPSPTTEICQNSQVCDWEVSAAATVNVVSPTGAVPEPRMAIPLALALAAFVIFRARPRLRRS